MPLSKTQLADFYQAASIWQQTKKQILSHCVPGTSLLELDAIATEVIKTHGAKATFKGFQGFPASLCLMVNEQLVHGIPSEYRLQSGDLLSVDCGVTFRGRIVDAAFSLVVGGDSSHPERAKFSAEIYQALQAGCQAAKSGNTTGDIGQAIEEFVTKAGYQLCREYTGHGVERTLHDQPTIYNFGVCGEGEKLKTGMVICIEPIVSRGSPKNHTQSDGWTVVLDDGSDGIQWEHCGIVTPDGLEVVA